MARRGEVYEGVVGLRRQTVMVVSADARNASWSSVLVAPILTSGTQFDILDTTVALGDAEPATGTVVCDLIYPASVQELHAATLHGSVSADALDAVTVAIAQVFEIV